MENSKCSQMALAQQNPRFPFLVAADSKLWRALQLNWKWRMGKFSLICGILIPMRKRNASDTNKMSSQTSPQLTSSKMDKLHKLESHWLNKISLHNKSFSVHFTIFKRKIQLSYNFDLDMWCQHCNALLRL